MNTPGVHVLTFVVRNVDYNPNEPGWTAEYFVNPEWDFPFAPWTVNGVAVSFVALTQPHAYQYETGFSVDGANYILEVKNDLVLSRNDAELRVYFAVKEFPSGNPLSTGSTTYSNHTRKWWSHSRFSRRP